MNSVFELRDRELKGEVTPRWAAAHELFMWTIMRESTLPAREGEGERDTHTHTHTYAYAHIRGKKPIFRRPAFRGQEYAVMSSQSKRF